MGDGIYVTNGLSSVYGKDVVEISIMKNNDKHGFAIRKHHSEKYWIKEIYENNKLIMSSEPIGKRTLPKYSND